MRRADEAVAVVLETIITLAVQLVGAQECSVQFADWRLAKIEQPQHKRRRLAHGKAVQTGQRVKWRRIHLATRVGDGGRPVPRTP
jgi:hypothetical protein